TGRTNSSNFPTVNQYQGNQGSTDVFVTKLASTGSSLVYSTYLGGSGSEVGYGIAVDSFRQAYITGYTISSNFPTVNQYQTDQGSADVFVTKLSSSGSSLAYSTYLGGSGNDEGYGIAVDSTGAAYITGNTNSSDFPTANQYQTDQGSTDVFVTKLASTGSSLEYSTYLGGSGNDYGEGIAVDSTGAAYITGYAESSDFPTVNQYQTDQGSTDVFVTRFTSNGSSLDYSTYLGGSSSDIGKAIAIDSTGTAYITGYTYSSNFPILNQYQTNQTGIDVFVLKLRWEEPNTAPVAVIDADSFGGIAPAIITFDGSKSYDTDGFVESWRWVFDDGATGTGEIIEHEYTAPGTYTARLQVKDDQDDWSAWASMQIIIYGENELSCALTVTPSSIKANGSEIAVAKVIFYYNPQDGSAAAPILYNLNPSIEADDGLFLGINQFDEKTGEFSDTLISGNPAQVTVSAVLAGQAVCTTPVTYTWPQPPLNFTAEVRENKSLFKSELYIDLSWEENTADKYQTTGYRIYRSTDNTGLLLIAEVPAGTYEYTDPSVSATSKYVYAISKVDTDGDESEKEVIYVN
ncbi:MAG: SBBP repeat-containing protein, partial [Acidobacteria bacterium]|nr:SBBP repeat-containing protein [Acidobacteriota bacterium]